MVEDREEEIQHKGTMAAKETEGISTTTLFSNIINNHRHSNITKRTILLQIGFSITKAASQV